MIVLDIRLNTGLVVLGEEMESRRRVVPALILLAVAAAAVAAYMMLKGGPGGAVPRDGTFSVVLWDDFDLAAYEGKVVLVDVGATWCGPCAMAVEELKTVREAFSGDELAIVSVFYDSRDDPSAVAEYAREHGMTWVLVYGRGASEVFPVQFYPTLFILDKNLKPAFRQVGVANGQDTIRAIRSLLGQ